MIYSPPHLSDALQERLVALGSLRQKLGTEGEPAQPLDGKPAARGSIKLDREIYLDPRAIASTPPKQSP